MNLNVYFTWHNSYTEYNKDFIYSCIKEACLNVQDKDDLQGVLLRIINVEDSDGNEDFDISIKKRQKLADIQINDVTIVLPKFFRLFGLFKRYKSVSINNNVAYEMRNDNIPPEQHINIMNTAYGSSADLPADIRNNTVEIKYNYSRKNRKDKETIKEKIISDFESQLITKALIAVRNQDKKYAPFVAWYTQSLGIEKQESFLLTDELKLLLKTIQNHRNGILRVIGLSGFGKTRLVFEAFSESIKTKSYRYYNFYTNRTSINIVCSAIKAAYDNEEDFIFVLDNCNHEYLRSLKALVNDDSINLPIITIFNDPNEQSEKGVNYLNLEETISAGVIDNFLAEKDLPKHISESIKNLAGKNLQMAILLVEAYQETGTLDSKLNDTELMDKLIGYAANTDERKILQSYSLFDFIGIEEPNEEQYKLLARNVCITPIEGENELKEIKFYELFKNKQKLFEQNGSLISIRPKTLAFYLANEWFEYCSPERLVKVLEVLEANKDFGGMLIESFAKQIRFLGYNPKAKEFIQKICGRHGPFGKAEVLNSPTAMRLFRSFVQINPSAVVDVLYEYVKSATENDLKNRIDIRRDFVWTVETLCFDKGTFYKGAEIMLLLALAENETFGNNATNQFLRLFSPVLSGTEANLEIRSKFLREHFAESENKQILLKALSRTLSWNAVYWGGAEIQGLKRKENYNPTLKEIIDYCITTLSILKKEIEEGTKYSENAKRIISGAVREFIHQNIFVQLLPKLEEIIKIVGNDWAEMLDSMKLIKRFDTPYMIPEAIDKIDEFIAYLSPDSFVTRFRNVEEYFKYPDIDLGYQKERELAHKKYSELVEEFIQSHLKSKEIIRFIYSENGLYTGEFGKCLAEKLNEKEQILNFIDISIEIIEELEKPNQEIFFYFLVNTNDYTLEYIKDNYWKNTNCIRLVFRACGAKQGDINKKNWFFEFIDIHSLSVMLLDDFASYYDWDTQNHTEVLLFLGKVASYKDCGITALLGICHRIFYFTKRSDFFMLAEKIVQIIYNAYLTKTFSVNEKAKFYELSVVLLKKFQLPKLAELTNTVILDSLKKTKSYDGNGYYRTLYSIMSERYFDIIWPLLSTALLSTGEQIFVYLNLEAAFRTLIGSYDKEDILHTERNKDKLLEWCKANSENAPQRIIRLIPIYENNEPTDFVTSLVCLYGNNIAFLDSLSSAMNSCFVKGSMVPYYKNEQKNWKYFRTLVTDKIAISWIDKTIVTLDSAIKNSERNEAEEEMMYN